MLEWEHFCPIEVTIPSLKREMDESGKERKLYRVEVFCNGRKHFVLRRHSDFQNLHRKLKKILIPPEFPSKRNPHLRTKPLDQRRQELEIYIQEILHQNEAVPQEVLDFLLIKHFPLMNKADSTDCQLIQQCVVTFSKDPFFLDACQGLPDVVVNGVLEGLYPRDNKIS